MRKVIVSNYISLDGMYAGPNGEIDWFRWDDEIAEQSKRLLDEIDTILFGRITYEGMAGFWPTPLAAGEDPAITRRMNALAKVVFSRTLREVAWSNSRLVEGGPAEEVRRLKEAPGRDMVIIGSGQIVRQLADLGLIDRYLLYVNPIALGQGKPLFGGLARPLNLRLSATRAFPSGVVLHDFQALTAGGSGTALRADAASAELTITREFDAPRDLVFQAHADPELVRRWWGPRRFTVVIDRLEPRPGGAWRVIHRDRAGAEWAFRGEIREFAPPDRIVMTLGPEWAPVSPRLDTVTFEDLGGGRTRLVARSRFRSEAERDGALRAGLPDGARESYERLAEMLAELSEKVRT